MGPAEEAARLAELERRCDELAAQAEIRGAIRRGLIRVVPRPGGGIRIVPQGGAADRGPP